MKQIFQEYENITGHTIEDAIENEFSGDVKKGLLAIGMLPFIIMVSGNYNVRVDIELFLLQ